MPREAVYQQQQPQQSHSPHPVTPSQHRQPAIQQQQQQHAQHSRRQQSSASSGSGQSSSNAMPDRVGPYTIREEIGRGSFATVYRGECVSTNPPSLVAIKAVVRVKLTAKLLGNLESEIRLLKNIKHRNVVELLDCLKTDAHIYLVMAYCSAGDLSQYIRKRGQVAGLPMNSAQARYPHPKDGGLNEMVVRSFLGQLSEAIKCFRAQDIIHRDIKPQNLLLHPSSHADIAAGHPEGIPLLRVADFGFARSLAKNDLAETLCGSPLYMAPEILRYDKYCVKADLWSVGAVAYEMAVGRCPYRAQNHVELLRRIDRGEEHVKFPNEPPRPGQDPNNSNEGGGGTDRQTDTVVADDIKALIRRLLKRNSAERISFNDFFAEAEAVARWGEGSLAPGVLEQPAPTTIRDQSPAIVRTASFRPSVQTTRSDPIVPRVAPVSAQATHEYTQHSQPIYIPSSAEEQEPAFIRIAATPEMAVPPTGGKAQTTTTEPPQLASRKSFTSKYIVDNAVDQRSAVPTQTIRTRDFAIPQPGTSVPSREPSRPPSSLQNPPRSNLSLQAPPNRPSHPYEAQYKDMDASGMTGEEDSVLGREYVVVEKRNVEVNALADELAAQPRRTSNLARRNSRGILTRQVSGMSPSPGIGLNAAGASPSPPSPAPYPPQPSTSAAYDHPPFASTRPYVPTYSSSPLSRGLAGQSTSYGTSPGKYYGAAFASGAAASAAAVVGAVPGAAIAKAFTLASLKLFGSPTQGIWLRKRSHRRTIERRDDAVADAAEERLLASLEDIAQKAIAIFDFADTRFAMMGAVLGSSSSTDAGQYSGSALRQSVTSPFVASASPPIGQPAHRPKRTASSSSVDRVPTSPLALSPAHSNPQAGSPLPAVNQAEHLPAEALVLYLKALAFLQKGIEMARDFCATRQGIAVNTAINDYVQWLRARFNECYERAEHAKSRLVGDIPDYCVLAEKLVFDRALEMSRAAAVSELMGENTAECEIAYDTALWMLFAILDDTMQDGEVVDEQVRRTVEQFVRSIQNRLDALRRKLRNAPPDK